MKAQKEEFKKNKLASIIQDMILSGAFLSGERLPAERELAERFGVSRPAVHDALLQLQTKGIIIMRPRHGCIVNDFSSSLSFSLLTELYRNNRIHSPEEIETELSEFRQVILTDVIKKIITRTKKLSPKTKKEFFLPLENLIKFSDIENIETSVHEDFEFYKTLILSAKNTIYHLVFCAAKEIYIYQFKRFLDGQISFLKTITENKRKFIEALKTGKQKKAVQMMLILTSPKTYRKNIEGTTYV